MAHAALLSGVALANSGLGMAHGVAPALGIHCRVPHGLACAVMLPAALRCNREVREQELAVLAETMCGRRFGSSAEAVDAVVSAVEQLCAEVGSPVAFRRSACAAISFPPSSPARTETA